MYMYIYVNHKVAPYNDKLPTACGRCIYKVCIVTRPTTLIRIKPKKRNYAFFEILTFGPSSPSRTSTLQVLTLVNYPKGRISSHGQPERIYSAFYSGDEGFAPIFSPILSLLYA